MMRSGCSSSQHDTLQAYKHARCRCPAAVAANTAAMKAYRLRLLQGWTGHIDGTGARRRLQALVANGWPMQALANELGISKCAVSQLCNSQRRTRAVTAARVRALYDSIADVEGPSASARIRARNRGWLAPLWWDDDTIDDPAHHPSLCDRPRPRTDVDVVVVDRLADGVPVASPTPAERFAAFQRLCAGGVPMDEIIRRLRLSWRTFASYRDRCDADSISGKWVAA